MAAIFDGDEFEHNWNAFESEAHRNAVEKGFWLTACNDAEKVALMHSELSEALEGMREPGPSVKIPGFTIVEEEMADLLIRVADYSCAKVLRTAQAVRAKMEYNRGRTFMHGKKF